MAQLTSFTGLLLQRIAPLIPLKQLRHRAAKIEATHPQCREELLPVLAYEASQRQCCTSGLVVSTNQLHVA